MTEAITDFIVRYKFIFLFYLAIVIFLVIKRKQLDFQAKIIVLYRTKWGIKWMTKYAQKHRAWVILLGYIGVGVGFIGMLTISIVLVKGLVDIFIKPANTAGVSLVLPGINVPGLGILPFWHWIAAIFIIAIVHEFSHGIVARAHNLEVKNTGIVFFGPIIGAFVESDEKKIVKEKDVTQYSILAAGAFSNILLAIVAILVLSFVTMPLQNRMTEPAGFTFAEFDNTGDYPFEAAGIKPGSVITGLDGNEFNDFQSFQKELLRLHPGDEAMVTADSKDYPITLAVSPVNSEQGYLGIFAITNKLEVKDRFQYGAGNAAYLTTNTANVFLRWLYLLSLGIGLFNLLPLPIVDGGRMAQVFLHQLRGKEKGEKSYRKISLFFLLVLLLSLLFPWLSKVLSGLF